MDLSTYCILKVKADLIKMRAAFGFYLDFKIQFASNLSNLLSMMASSTHLQKFTTGRKKCK